MREWLLNHGHAVLDSAAGYILAQIAHKSVRLWKLSYRKTENGRITDKSISVRIGGGPDSGDDIPKAGIAK